MSVSEMPTLEEKWTLRRKAALDAIPPAERTMEDGILRVTYRFRGLTIEQAVRYLEHLGGTRTSPDRVTGVGWNATLDSRIAPVGPSYRLTEFSVAWTGVPAVVEPVVRHFRLKAFRAPG